MNRNLFSALLMERNAMAVILGFIMLVASFIDIDFPELERLPVINARGGLSAVEAYLWHKDQIARAGAAYDPRVLVRLTSGEGISGIEDAPTLYSEDDASMERAAASDGRFGSTGGGGMPPVRCHSLKRLTR